MTPTDPAPPQSNDTADNPCEIAIRDGIATVTLNRPAIHNAFDERLIAKLTQTFVELDDERDVRVVVLAGAGRSFCAGADLNWMRRMAAFDHDENLRDATALAAMLRALYALSKPTIARVHGAAYGGGVGLIAACDIAIGTSNADFAFTEVRLGLVPAVISVPVLPRLLPRAALELCLTGETFDADRAAEIGLLSRVVTDPDAELARLVGLLAGCEPKALAATKAMLRRDRSGLSMADDLAAMSALSAEYFASAEAAEGIAAFRQKRPPAWATGG